MMKKCRELIEEHHLNLADVQDVMIIFDDFLTDVKNEKPELVDEMLMKLDLRFNPHFDKETGEYAVSKMKNRDGSTGQKWSFAETSKVLKEKGYDFAEGDWYFVLNMKYSDEYEPGKGAEEYIKAAYMFLDDVDAPKDKAKRYYLAMHD